MQKLDMMISNDNIDAEFDTLKQIEHKKYFDYRITEQASMKDASYKRMLPGDVIAFPTFKSEQENEHVLDTKNLCCSSLALLKKNDPFMYYSIKDVKKMELSDEEPDMSSLNLDSKSPTKCNSSKKLDSHRYVRRRTRISYERYIDLSLDSLDEIHGPSKKKQRPSSPDVEEFELLYKYAFDMSGVASSSQR
jgi:hypothetical protein